MADMFADWKAANEAKAAARRLRQQADLARKTRDDAWDAYDDQYNNYKKFGHLRPDDKEEWLKWLSRFSRDYNEAADAWLKAEETAHKMELEAAAAVKKFNLDLPPDVQPMPMDF